MENSIHNIIAYLIDNEIEYKDLSGSDVILLTGAFNLTDKQLRGMIKSVYSNKFAIEFSDNKFFIHETV